jgi:hypothetical protein
MTKTLLASLPLHQAFLLEFLASCPRLKSTNTSGEISENVSSFFFPLSGILAHQVLVASDCLKPLKEFLIILFTFSSCLIRRITTPNMKMME